MTTWPFWQEPQAPGHLSVWLGLTWSARIQGVSKNWSSKMRNGIVHHKSDRKSCVLPTADRNTHRVGNSGLIWSCYNSTLHIKFTVYCRPRDYWNSSNYRSAYLFIWYRASMCPKTYRWISLKLKLKWTVMSGQLVWRSSTLITNNNQKKDFPGFVTLSCQINSIKMEFDFLGYTQLVSLFLISLLMWADTHRRNNN